MMLMHFCTCTHKVCMKAVNALISVVLCFISVASVISPFERLVTSFPLIFYSYPTLIINYPLTLAIVTKVLPIFCHIKESI